MRYWKLQKRFGFCEDLLLQYTDIISVKDDKNKDVIIIYEGEFYNKVVLVIGYEDYLSEVSDKGDGIEDRYYIGSLDGKSVV